MVLCEWMWEEMLNVHGAAGRFCISFVCFEITLKLFKYWTLCQSDEANIFDNWWPYIFGGGVVQAIHDLNVNQADPPATIKKKEEKNQEWDLLSLSNWLKCFFFKLFLKLQLRNRIFIYISSCSIIWIQFTIMWSENYGFKIKYHHFILCQYSGVWLFV